MNIDDDLTADYVRELFDYDPVSGNLIWKVQKSPRALIGSIAGHNHATGYVKLRIDYKNYSAHRIVWLWWYGTNPVGMIDHINGDPADNRIENLRDVSQSINCRNTYRVRNGDACVKESINGWAAYIYLPMVGTREEALANRQASIRLLVEHGLYPNMESDYVELNDG